MEHGEHAAADELRAFAQALDAGEPFTQEMHDRLCALGLTLDCRYYCDPDDDHDPLEGIETEGALDYEDGGLSVWEAEMPHRVFCSHGETMVNVTGQDGDDSVGRRTAVFAAVTLSQAVAAALEALAYQAFPGEDDPNIFLLEPPARRRPVPKASRPELDSLEEAQTEFPAGLSDGGTIELG